MNCGFSDVEKTDVGYECKVCGKKFDSDWMRRAIAMNGIRSLYKINPQLMKDYNAAMELFPTQHV